MSEKKYFAAREAKKVADRLVDKSTVFYQRFNESGYYNLIRRAYLMYYNIDPDSYSDGHYINFTGEQGELVELKVNQYRNIAENMLNMITASRPLIEARAINTDSKSTIQTKLANGLLDYYMREKELEYYLRSACEHSIALGTGWIRMEWDGTAGEIIEYDEELDVPIHEGDVTFEVLSVYDVSYDNTKDDPKKQDWYVVRTFKNKFDLAAKYPEFESDIVKLKTKNELQDNMYAFESFLGTDESDDVPVYEFFHKRTDSMPDGRYLMYLNSEIVLEDIPLPYDDIPIFRISPKNVLGTPFGYTPMFDLLPIQEAFNSLVSTIFTNQHTFGVQNILVPRGANIAIEALEGGLNIIEADVQNGMRPEALNLTQTPAEIFNFSNTLVQYMETISGMNSVVRGNPEASLRSGSALALIQGNAIQYMSGLAMEYNRLIENVGTALFKMLKRYANTKRVAAIVGEMNRSYLTEFSGEDLSNITRIVVSAGNPLSRTISGRLEMASELLQYQLLKDPRQYFQIIETGRLDHITDEFMKGRILLEGENEQLLAGQVPPVLLLDNHQEHINEHLKLLDDPKLRENPQAVEVVMAHIQEHMQLWQQAPNNLLQIRGIPPFPMEQPPMPEGMPQQAPQGGETPQMDVTQDPMQQFTDGFPQVDGSLPQPPEGFEGVPLTPQDLQAKIQR